MTRLLRLLAAVALLVGTQVSAQEESVGAERPALRHELRKSVEATLRGYLDAYAAQDREVWREYVTDDFLLIENGYPVGIDRFTAAWDPQRPRNQTYELHDLDIEVIGEVALYRFGLGWYEQGERFFWGIESGHARLVGGQWRVVQHHMTWLPPRRQIEPALLLGYVGEYRGVDHQGREDRLVLFREDDLLYMRRPDGRPVAASVGQVKILPSFDDVFFAEFVNGMLRFEHDEDGSVQGFVFTTSLEFPPGARQVRYERIR